MYLESLPTAMLCVCYVYEKRNLMEQKVFSEKLVAAGMFKKFLNYK
jgi:hypothetical protein